MATYQKGDGVTVLYVWEDENHKIKTKHRPGIVYDVIGDDHYCILFFGKDRTGKFPGFLVEQNSDEGKKLKLKKDSFLSLEFYKLRKEDINKLICACDEDFLDKIDDEIDNHKVERPLN